MSRPSLAALLAATLALAACTIQTGLSGPGAPAAPAAAGRASPPAAGAEGARRDGNAVKHPGPDLKTMRATPCTAANDHCLRPQAWFVGDPFDEEGMRGGRVYGARAVFDFEGAWWTWLGPSEVKPGPAFRTVPATRGVKPGDLVVWWSDRYDPVPPTEFDAHFSTKWTIGVAASVSGDTIRLGNQDIKADSARVVVERR